MSIPSSMGMLLSHNLADMQNLWGGGGGYVILYKVVCDLEWFLAYKYVHLNQSWAGIGFFVILTGMDMMDKYKIMEIRVYI